MKKLLGFAGLLLSLAMLLSGCSDNSYSLSKADLAAFKDASPEVKQTWEQALKADKANDYLTAGNNYRTLLGKELSPQQMAAVQTALGGLNIRLNEAAAKGDAAAQKALEAAKQAAPRR